MPTPSLEHIEPPPTHYGDFRVGPSTTAGWPVMCLELSPTARFRVESCGTGAGFMHHDSGREVAYFRGLVRLVEWLTPASWLQLRVTAGFAEIQIGQDEAGFDFTSAGSSGHETAGPEVGVSLRALTPIGRGLSSSASCRRVRRGCRMPWTWSSRCPDSSPARR